LRNDPQTLQSLGMPGGIKTFYHLPVLVMSSAADVHQFKISPEEVAVTIQGDPQTVSRLNEREIRALVDLTGIETTKDLSKRIEISVPAGISQIRVVPAEVRVLPPKR